jgi:transcriptional regulator with XRE-family HTH domain
MDHDTSSSADPLDPQAVIGDRVGKIREARGMTRDKLAATLQDLGIDWSRLTVNRLEIGRREGVTVRELLALCLALEVSPVDLLVPAHLTDQAYRVAPRAIADAGNVREWIRGEELLTVDRTTIGSDGTEDPFTQPAAVLLDAIRWMPADRAQRVGRRYFEEEDR